MGKCTLCGKEFPENVSPLVFLEHFGKEHQKEGKKTIKEIKDKKWDKIINDKNNLEESKKIVKEMQTRIETLKNKNIKRLK